MSTQPPVDLDELRGAMRAAGIEDIVEPLLDLFTTEGEKGMSQLSSASAAGDLDALGRTAHSLKSSAGNIRAKTLAGLLQELENAASEGDRAKAASLLPLVEAEHAAAVRYLADARRRPAGPG
jgi:HPt (histidine-containing phosphotransfer) domain-containing protein